MTKAEQIRRDRTAAPIRISITWPNQREPSPKHFERLIMRAFAKYPYLGKGEAQDEAVRLCGNYIARCMGKPKVSFTEKP